MNNYFFFKNFRKQSFISFLAPGMPSRYLSATLFLKGRIMDYAKGDPVEAARLLFGTMPEIISPKQVHGTRIVLASQEMTLPQRPEADGIFLCNTDLFISLTFADCFPILISSSQPEPWALVLHSGYKGTLKNIVKEGISIVKQRYGNDSLNSAFSWLGPGIGPCCYTRRADDSSIKEAIDNLPAECLFSTGNGLVSIDIAKAISMQLHENGLPIDHIYRIPNCTSCEDSLFYSYRRNGTSCRMMLLVRLITMYQNSPFWWENI